jgi:hypothetical protein
MPQTPQTDTQRRRSTGAQPSNAAPLPTQGETEDHVYGLVSVLYHALQGAETYERYIEDAEQAGDDELVRFFEECRNQESARASSAKRLLIDRIDDSVEDEDDSEDADEDQDDR